MKKALHQYSSRLDHKRASRQLTLGIVAPANSQAWINEDPAGTSTCFPSISSATGLCTLLELLNDALRALLLLPNAEGPAKSLLLAASMLKYV